MVCRQQRRFLGPARVRGLAISEENTPTPLILGAFHAIGVSIDWNSFPERLFWAISGAAGVSFFDWRHTDHRATQLRALRHTQRPIDAKAL
jgi:hypothetical protein